MNLQAKTVYQQFHNCFRAVAVQQQVNLILHFVLLGPMLRQLGKVFLYIHHYAHSSIFWVSYKF